LDDLFVQPGAQFLAWEDVMGGDPFARLRECFVRLRECFVRVGLKHEAFTRPAQIENLFDYSVAKGAKVTVGGSLDAADRTIHPTMLTDVTPGMLIMQEEIFGPIVPGLTYQPIDDVIEYIAVRGNPLALYIFSVTTETTLKEYAAERHRAA
jgi:acyl-CoA reductase-like NAD-dependent aldehyde dehydrogenase